MHRFNRIVPKIKPNEAPKEALKEAITKEFITYAETIKENIVPPNLSPSGPSPSASTSSKSSKSTLKSESKSPLNDTLSISPPTRPNNTDPLTEIGSYQRRTNNSSATRRLNPKALSRAYLASRESKENAKEKAKHAPKNTPPTLPPKTATPFISGQSASAAPQSEPSSGSLQSSPTPTRDCERDRDHYRDKSSSSSRRDRRERHQLRSRSRSPVSKSNRPESKIRQLSPPKRQTSLNSSHRRRSPPLARLERTEKTEKAEKKPVVNYSSSITKSDSSSSSSRAKKENNTTTSRADREKEKSNKRKSLHNAFDSSKTSSSSKPPTKRPFTIKTSKDSNTAPNAETPEQYKVFIIMFQQLALAHKRRGDKQKNPVIGIMDHFHALCDYMLNFYYVDKANTHIPFKQASDAWKSLLPFSDSLLSKLQANHLNEMYGLCIRLVALIRYYIYSRMESGIRPLLTKHLSGNSSGGTQNSTYTDQTFIEMTEGLLREHEKAQKCYRESEQYMTFGKVATQFPGTFKDVCIDGNLLAGITLGGEAGASVGPMFPFTPYSPLHHAAIAAKCILNEYVTKNHLNFSPITQPEEFM